LSRRQPSALQKRDTDVHRSGHEIAGNIVHRGSSYAFRVAVRRVIECA
jgi:hypothetical protein